LEYEQKNWIELTPITQYALNDAISSTTGATPNFITFGTERILGKDVRKEEEGVPHHERMKVIHDEVRKDIDWAKISMKKYYDQRRVEAPSLKKGDRVYIRRRTSGEKSFNIKTGRESQKLDEVKIGPYCVSEELPHDNYRIALPPRMRIHPVFHISLLDKTKNPISTLRTDVEDEFEVERILDKRRRNGTTEYLVKWKDYSESENTWEPTRNLHCPDRVTQFHNLRDQTGRNRNEKGVQE
jgi:hypothetical protein